MVHTFAVLNVVVIVAIFILTYLLAMTDRWIDGVERIGLALGATYVAAYTSCFIWIGYIGIHYAATKYW